MKKLIFSLLAALLAASISPAHATVAKKVIFQAEVWADNWFALYVNGKKVGEDSVPITTERSFNSEKITFTASYPFTVGIIAKDFTENASGLEYIGKPNQQIGDAGIILQIRDSTTGQIVTQTSTDWKVLVINKAPLNPDCVTSSNPVVDCKFYTAKIPASWATSTYKDSSWKFAREFTKDAVGVKEGYFDINWAPSAALVWSSDLKLDNVILLRKVIKTAPAVSASKLLKLSSPDFENGGNLPKDFTCDGKGISPSFSWSNVPTNAQSLVLIMDTEPGPLRLGEVDTGKHFYLTIFNIPRTVSFIEAGATNIGTMGQNFQGKNTGYTPPCSQGPGAKKYSVHLYALSTKLSLNAQEATESKLLAAMDGNVISRTSMDAYYSRK